MDNLPDDNTGEIKSSLSLSANKSSGLMTKHNVLSPAPVVSPEILKTQALVKVTDPCTSTITGTPDRQDHTSSLKSQKRQQKKENRSKNNVHQTEEDEEVDDDDSSNDDSSYFNDPIHLPEPMSGRRFSWSSSTSVPQAASNQQLTKLKHKESDASLSLSSDDSDVNEINHHSDSYLGSFRPIEHGFQLAHNPYLDPFQYYPNPAHSQSNERSTSTVPLVAPSTTESFPELYTQQLIRMHSVSSLVSNSSHNSTICDNELGAFGTEHGNRLQSSSIPSGRLSPVMGEHPPSRNQNVHFTSPSTINPGPSPPLIIQSNVLPPGMYPQPQPHVLPPGHISDWMAPENKTISTLTTAFPKEHKNEVEKNSKQTRQSKKSKATNSKDGRSNQKIHDEVDPADPLFRRLSSRTDKRVQERSPSRRSSIQSEKGFKVYWQRWVMLFYMSALNLLSDWTCYSVAPIALLTEEAFGHINAESLVTLFLVANAIASACEPMILARLGLRRTVLFGALLLMIGNITKSGGMPPIIQAEIEKGSGEWRVYLGFFIVGLSQPLYQCTPALLSASWFPEAERTTATSVALNANQIGIGFAFIFGTLLVAKSDDIPPYFGLLSILSTTVFLGTLIQFSDAPPTPPSETAKVVRGTLEVNLPTVSSFIETMRNMGQSNDANESSDCIVSQVTPLSHPSSVRAAAPAPASAESKTSHSFPLVHGLKSRKNESKCHSSVKVGASKKSKENDSRNRKRRKANNRNQENTTWVVTDIDTGFHGLRRVQTSSPTSLKVSSAKAITEYEEVGDAIYPAPSPMLPGPIASVATAKTDDHDVGDINSNMYPYQHHVPFPHYSPNAFMTPGYPYALPRNPQADPNVILSNPFVVHPQFMHPQWQPSYQQHAAYYYQQAYHQGFHAPSIHPIDPYHQFNSYQNAPPPPPHMRGYESVEFILPPSGIDEGAEPVLTITPHHLDINIRDDQIVLSLRACLARPGFVHSLVAFTVSGIAINTLSTFMDYLVRLNGAGREYTGIVGGCFQFIIMISSLVVGKLCDKTRAYYSIIIGMLVLGAFGLAQCGVSLDADRGNELRFALVIVAALVGPLQPVSTELGVDVAYPLSENTVLVIQQLFSNLLSAAFIPCFKAMRDIGRGSLEDGTSSTGKPQYTFSFYLLIVLHAVCTVFFATFNGRYLRYEHEQDKVAEEARKKAEKDRRAFFRASEDESAYNENVPFVVSSQANV